MSVLFYKSFVEVVLYYKSFVEGDGWGGSLCLCLCLLELFSECLALQEGDGWGGSLAPGAANCLLFPPQPGNRRGGDLPQLYQNYYERIIISGL